MTAKHVLVIAEAGVNHNGDLNMAKRLIRIAAEAGADIVKFQTFSADKLVSRTAPKADYQMKNIGTVDNSQFEMLKKLEMPEHWHYELIDEAKRQNISFLSTGFDEDAVDFLDRLGMAIFKIPSGELTNKRYLQRVARTTKPVILSTGMGSIEEIRSAVAVLTGEGITRDSISILHCNTEYPTPMQDVNLLAMNAIAKEFGVNVGYSDHTEGIEVAISAVALGASVIEKHFTIDRSLPGPDHKASIEPEDLKRMIKSIRNVELAISGTGQKHPSPSELKNMAVARKSIHLKKDIDPGKIILEDDLVMKRPGDGISPMMIDEVIGKRALMKLTADQKLLWEHIAK